MHKFRPLLKKLLTPITIMLIPHSRTSSINFKIPTAVLGMMLVFVCIGIVYTISLTTHLVDYYLMKKKYAQMNGQIQSMQTTVRSLKQSEEEFKQLFSLKSKKQVLDAVKKDDSDGSIDLEELQRHINESLKSVAEIKRYLVKEKDLYRSTPSGWPVTGRISSGFGERIHPQTGKKQFHTGLDLSAASGTPVHATADGIVSVADRTNGSGNVLVIEHGHGFRTVYAHNSRLDVKVGQTVERGQIIASTGSTGNSTGPHVHYEVWKQGHYINPTAFILERTSKN